MNEEYRRNGPYMKKRVTDVQDLNAEMDAEDQELMRMFPRNREYALDDMILIEKGGRMFLKKKYVIARKLKILHDVVYASLTIAGFLLLAAAFLSWRTGVGNPSVLIFASDMCLIPYLVKEVPKDVKC